MVLYNIVLSILLALGGIAAICTSIARKRRKREKLAADHAEYIAKKRGIEQQLKDQDFEGLDRRLHWFAIERRHFADCNQCFLHDHRRFVKKVKRAIRADRCHKEWNTLRLLKYDEYRYALGKFMSKPRNATWLNDYDINMHQAALTQLEALVWDWVQTLHFSKYTIEETWRELKMYVRAMEWIRYNTIGLHWELTIPHRIAEPKLKYFLLSSRPTDDTRLLLYATRALKQRSLRQAKIALAMHREHRWARQALQPVIADLAAFVVEENIRLELTQ